MSHSYLVVREGFRRGVPYRLGSVTLSVGRDPKNEIQIIDDAVSRRHAMICSESSGYRVADLQSRNGTFVNETRVGEVLLCLNDTVRLGNTTLQFVEADDVGWDGTTQRKVTDRVIVEPSTTTLDIADLDLPDKPESVPDESSPEAAAPDASATMQRIHALNLAAARGAETTVLLDMAVDLVREVVAADRFVVYRKSSSGKLKTLARHVLTDLPKGQRQIPPHKMALGRSLERKRPLLLNDLPGSGVRAVAVVPILKGDRAVSVLYADRVGHFAKPISEEDHDTLLMVAFTLRASLG